MLINTNTKSHQSDAIICLSVTQFTFILKLFGHFQNFRKCLQHKYVGITMIIFRIKIKITGTGMLKAVRSFHENLFKQMSNNSFNLGNSKQLGTTN